MNYLFILRILFNFKYLKDEILHYPMSFRFILKTDNQSVFHYFTALRQI